MKLASFLGESLSISLASIFSNKLRSVLTMAIIAIGIMALVGIFTAIESLKHSVTDSFSALGANGFTVVTRMRGNVNGKM
ncbi:MAG: ABC transporter permease, partial [Mucinivorans sp.]